jgi:hypothetical protein
MAGDQTVSAKFPQRILDPMDRISEVLFGLIMALTFTSTLGVVTADNIRVRTMLVAALGCNLAWGIIDAGVYLMARLNERGRNLIKWRAVRNATDANAAHRIIADSLPPVLAPLLLAYDQADRRDRQQRADRSGHTPQFLTEQVGTSAEQ